MSVENEVKLFVFIYIDDKNQPQYLFDYTKFYSDLNKVDINYFKTTYGIDKWNNAKELDELQNTFIIGEITKDKENNSYNVKLTDTSCTSTSTGILDCKPDESEINIKVEESFIENLEPLFRYAENDSIVKNYNCDLLIQKYPEQSKIFVELCKKMKEIMLNLMFYLLNNITIDYDKLKLPNISSNEIQKIKKYMDAFIKLNENKITITDIDNIFQNMYNSFLSRRDISYIIESIIQNTNQHLALKNEVESEDEKVDEEKVDEEKVDEEKVDKKEEETPLPETAQLENENTTIEHIISSILNNINKDYEFNYISNIINKYHIDTSIYLPPTLIKNSKIDKKYKQFMKGISIDNNYFMENINNILLDKIPDRIEKLLNGHFCKDKNKPCDIRLEFLKKMVNYQHNNKFIGLINTINKNIHNNWSSDTIKKYIDFWNKNDNKIEAGSIVRISYTLTADITSGIKPPPLLSIGIVKSVNVETRTYTISMYNIDEKKSISFIGTFKINFVENQPGIIVFIMIDNKKITINTIDLIMQQKDLTNPEESSSSIKSQKLPVNVNVQPKQEEAPIVTRAVNKNADIITTRSSTGWNNINDNLQEVPGEQTNDIITGNPKKLIKSQSEKNINPQEIPFKRSLSEKDIRNNKRTSRKPNQIKKQNISKKSKDLVLEDFKEDEL
jgi:hypothetical protein